MFDFIVKNNAVLVPLATYLVGFLSPYIQNRLEKIVHSSQYKFLAKVYDQIDPQLFVNVESQIPFLELIRESIFAVADKKLSSQEVNKLVNIVIRDFDYIKALRKNNLYV